MYPIPKFTAELRSIARLHHEVDTVVCSPYTTNASITPYGSETTKRTGPMLGFDIGMAIGADRPILLQQQIPMFHELLQYTLLW